MSQFNFFSLFFYVILIRRTFQKTYHQSVIFPLLFTIYTKEQFWSRKLPPSFICIIPPPTSATWYLGANKEGQGWRNKLGVSNINTEETLGYVKGALDSVSTTTLSEPLIYLISSQCDCRNNDHLINLWFGDCNEFKKVNGLCFSAQTKDNASFSMVE